LTVLGVNPEHGQVADRGTPASATPTPAVTQRVYFHVLREHAAGVGDIFAQAVKASVSKSASQTGKDDQ